MGIQRERARPAAFDALVALSLGALLLIAAAAGYYHLTLPPGVAEPLSIPGSRLQLIVGSGLRRGEALDVNGFHADAGEKHAIAVRRAPLAAGDFAFLDYRISTPPPAASLRFTWRRASNPGEVHSVPLNRNDRGPAVVRLHGEPGWQGMIVEVGIHAVARGAKPDLRIDELRLEPAHWRLALAAHLSAWTGFRGWDQKSINYLFGTRDGRGLSPLPVAAAWAGIASLLVCLLGLARGRQAPAAYAAAALVPWLGIDLLWQEELSSQLAETRARFAGKPVHERHMADLDAWIYSYIQRLKAEHLPPEPARIFVMHDARKHHYDRLKAQYYLLPHNVYNFGAGPGKGAYRRGDFILILRGTTDPVADADGRVLRFASGHRLRVRLLDSEVRGQLYQVRMSKMPWERP